MEFWQALLLGALQGISELFPVSSLGQTILIPVLLGWNIDYQSSHFLSFLVALHLATATALLIYFWREWRAVIMAFVGSARRRQLVYDRASKFAWLLVVGTIVVGAVGLVLEKPLRQLFEDPKVFWLTAVFLMINGGVMLYGEYVRRRAGQPGRAATSTVAAGATASPTGTQPTSTQRSPLGGTSGPSVPGSSTSTMEIGKAAEDLSFAQGAIIGATQTLALLPGFSRSGLTIVSGLLAGLNHEEAARFSFMLATPVIGLAALLKVPDLFKADARDILGMTVAAAVLAGITAYLSVRFLMRYFETRRLDPFGYYCLVFGAFSLIVIVLRG
jgi:undecaprenyl-diphosphatase